MVYSTRGFVVLLRKSLPQNRNLNSAVYHGVMCIKENIIIIFTEAFVKAKNKLLVLSGVCLFIGLTEALPKAISVIGLNLSERPHIAGWFLFAVTAYFFLIAFVFGALDIIKHYLPSYILSKSSNLSGDTIGLTEEEIELRRNSHLLESNEIGTDYSEMADIQRKKVEIDRMYNARFIKLSNFFRMSFELVLPLLFGIGSLVIIFKFLWLRCS